MSQTDAGEAERSVHLMIAGVMADFDQKCQTPKNQIEFEQAVQDLNGEIFEKFRGRYERIKNAEKFKNIFLNEVRSRQDELLQSTLFGNVFLLVKDINDDLDIDQTYFEAILIYCEKEGIQERQPLIHYFVTVHALLSVYHQIRGFRLVNGKATAAPLQAVRPTKLSSMGKPYRFFSFDLNLFKFINDSDVTEEENTRNWWQNQQIVLETKFASAFKKTAADKLPSFLDEQYHLTLAPKDEFINLVEQIGYANLKMASQGSSLKKTDIFRVWIAKKKAELPKKTSAVKTILSLFRDGQQPQSYVDILRQVKPAIVDQTGHYILGQRSKGAVVAWLDVLERLGKINSQLDPESKTKLINDLIPGLNISTRSFGNTGRAYEKYYHEILRMAEKL